MNIDDEFSLYKSVIFATGMSYNWYFWLDVEKLTVILCGFSMKSRRTFLSDVFLLLNFVTQLFCQLL